MTDFAIDTSVAVPLLVPNHPDHDVVVRWAGDRVLALAGHAEAETYSVLTRLPDPYRIDGPAAARALSTGFASSVHPLLPASVVQRIANAGVARGAVYDALVAIAAADAALPLATCDARALPTYTVIGVRTEVVH